MLHTKKMRNLFAAADESGDGVLEALAQLTLLLLEFAVAVFIGNDRKPDVAMIFSSFMVK